jgi:hypothetical protein
MHLKGRLSINIVVLDVILLPDGEKFLVHEDDIFVPVLSVPLEERWRLAQGLHRSSNKKTQATKCSDHRTISLISYIAKIIAKILRRRIGRKIEEVLGEDQFGFRRGKGTRDAIGMMRIIAD